eukprot:TRINITY_DN9065_c0_g1_i1.p2 TRINITY_DN9065_c0_g1~~TRINITY_DN9065_c0_g1_i1.p2  ORF type:complete len:649 (+),score=200.47 TRINITY_DN9065_c0_g1_i1:64-2010(+)
MAEASSVRDELAEKRRRLQELRSARNRGQLGSLAAGGGSPTRTAAAAVPPATPVSPSVTSPGETAPAATSSAASDVRARLAARRQTSPAPDPALAGQPPPAGSDILSKLGGSTAREAARTLPKQPTLRICKPAKLTWDIAPCGRADQYSKETQTVHTGNIEGGSGAAEPGSPATPNPQKARQGLWLSTTAGQFSKEKATKAKAEIEADDDEVADELTEQERIDALKSRGFAEFFKSSSFVIERALAEPDVMPPGTVDSEENVLVRGRGEPLIRLQIFNDSAMSKKITKGNPVTALEFSPHASGNQEMFLASYFKRPESEASFFDVEGQVLIWSMRVNQRPYQTLNAPADVCKASYCKFKSNLVIGGLYNGQVCLWDTRVGSDPVQLSPLTVDAHCHPVCGLDVVGSVNTHSLVTMSSDGKLCAWQMDKLHTPIETEMIQQQLNIGGGPDPREISTTSFAFRENETAKYYVGTEPGTLLAGTRNSGIPPDHLAGHTSPITAVHCHPASPGNADDYTDLVLTSSMDWTCKLWCPSKSNKPLFQFEDFTDYVYDIKWSPVHPAVFASVGGAGQLSVWNLIESMETPIGKVDASSSSGKALCRLSWSSDGRNIVVGDSTGDVSLWEVAGNEANPKAADWPLLGQKLEEINSV